MKILAQLLIEVAREKLKKTPLLHKLVSFQMPNKRLQPEVFNYFKYLREKLPLSQKLDTSEGAVSQNVFSCIGSLLLVTK